MAEEHCRRPFYDVGGTASMPPPPGEIQSPVPSGEPAGGPSTLQVIEDRIRARSQPGNRDDPYNVQLVAQGAGLRGGAVTVGIVGALRDLGFSAGTHYNGLDVFDGFHGASSASIIMAFAAAERDGDQLEVMQHILTDDLSSDEFFNIRRLLNGLRGAGRPAMDVGFLIEVLRNRKPLPWERLIGQNRPVVAYTTSAVDGRAKAFDLSTMKSQDEVLNTLYVSCRYPIFAGPPIKDNDGEYGVDGGVAVVGPPIRNAIGATCCTHLLGIARPPNWTKDRKSPLTEVAALVLGRSYPGLREPLRTLRHRAAENMAFIEDAERHPPDTPSPETPLIQTVRIPSRAHRTFRMDKSAEALTEGLESGKDALAKVIDGAG
ncbi:MAG: patatin-like phospholipase family protein [Candidatus Saccharimonadales bacterium]